MTERKRMEQALKKSPLCLHELFDEAPVGYYDYDRCGCIVKVNRTHLEVLGYEREEVLGRHVWEFFPDPEPGRSQILAKLEGALPPARGAEHLYRRKGKGAHDRVE